MSEMVERIARIIDVSRDGAENSEGIARMVLNAMREPTQAMLDVSMEDGAHPVYASEFWKLMIDEALR